MPKLIAQNGDEGIFQDENTGAQFSVYLPGMKNPPVMEQQDQYSPEGVMSGGFSRPATQEEVLLDKYPQLKMDEAFKSIAMGQQGPGPQAGLMQGLKSQKNQAEFGAINRQETGRQKRISDLGAAIRSNKELGIDTSDLENKLSLELYQNPSVGTSSGPKEVMAPSVASKDIAGVNQNILDSFKIDDGSGRLAGGFDRARAANMSLARVKADYMNKTADTMLQAEDKLNALESERAAKAQKWAERSDQMFSAIQKSLDDVRNTKIDPWANASTGQKVAASIAIILGAVGQSLKGGKNMGLEVINQQLDRDIDAQKANLANKKDYANSLGNSYRMLREMGADDLQATAAMKIAAIEKVKMQTERMAYASGSKEAIEQAKLTNAEWDIKQGQLSQDMMAKAQDQFLKEYKPERMTELGMAPYGSGDDVSKFREKYSQFKNADRMLGELMSITQKGGKSMSFDKLKPKAEVLQTALIGMLRLPLTGPGALTETEREMIKSIIPDPTKLMSLDSSTMAKLQTLQEQLRGNVSNEAQGLGYSPLKFGKIETISGKGAFERVE